MNRDNCLHYEIWKRNQNKREVEPVYRIAKCETCFDTQELSFANVATRAQD